ncbi:uncharacterized mitochondrial protein AtMg00860-like [Lycium barbarum]|uniref:uncharacterized mitochondrial protein AtMg00860-like n=1 Tax=Lycium barbarum TaxID=112863 RepID=UPI00293F0800|nr:uncharacterized mitochondrial protein AtMg00860-like [Lycium barbarum]
MPFGLTNAPATFCNLMNNVLFEYLDDFVLVYLDDIVIYSCSLEEHVSHLKMVLSRLREYKLYVKMEKCEFAQQEIKFLRHLVSQNQVRMDPNKVQAIVDWQAPQSVKDLRSFLGWANYYRKFIAGYSKKAVVLTDLLKKNVVWAWTEKCDGAFNLLKEAIASELILRLPDFELPFEVHIDASDKAMRAAHASVTQCVRHMRRLRSVFKGFAHMGEILGLESVCHDPNVIAGTCHARPSPCNCL